jgi:hypothetical protein
MVVETLPSLPLTRYAATSLGALSLIWWFTGKVPISVERLIEISLIALISLERPLSNSVPARLSQTIRALAVRERSRPSRRRSRDITDARPVLLEISRGQGPEITDRPAFLAAAGASPSALRKHLQGCTRVFASFAKD